MVLFYYYTITAGDTWEPLYFKDNFNKEEIFKSETN